MEPSCPRDGWAARSPGLSPVPTTERLPGPRCMERSDPKASLRLSHHTMRQLTWSAVSSHLTGGDTRGLRSPSAPPRQAAREPRWFQRQNSPQLYQLCESLKKRTLLFLKLSPSPFQSSELMIDNPLCFKKSMAHMKKNSPDYMERSPNPPKISP